jgi:hypothetical protein
VTPAQWIALIQVLTGGSQTLVLDSSGAGDATGGSFTLASGYNLIKAGVGGNTTSFDKIVIPQSVTEIASTPTITTTTANGGTGNVTVQGLIDFTAAAGGTITAAGNITATNTGLITANSTGASLLTLNSAGAAGIGSVGNPVYTQASILAPTASAANGAVYISDSALVFRQAEQGQAPPTASSTSWKRRPDNRL